MKIVTIDEFRERLDEHLAGAAENDVVLTQHGKPYVIIKAVPEGVDLGSAAYETSTEFWEMIHLRRREEGIPWEEAVKVLNLSD